MIREIDDKMSEKLGILVSSKIPKLMNLLGAFGLMENYRKYCIGVVVQDQFHVEKVAGLDHELIEELLQRFSMIVMEYTLDKINHETIKSYVDMGFSFECHGEMRQELGAMCKLVMRRPSQ